MPSFATAIPAAVGLFTASKGASAAKSAANTQAAAADAASQVQWNMYNQNREDAKPWREAGEFGLGQLTSGLQPGNQFARQFTMADYQADPGYAFRVGEGVKALERGAAARGRMYSGPQGKALLRYGQQAGSEEYSNAFNRYRLQNQDLFNRYASLAGVGQTTQQQLANQASNLANNLGEIGMQRGNVQAAGIIGANNAMTNALNQGMRAYSMQSPMSRNQAPAPYQAINPFGTPITPQPDNGIAWDPYGDF